MRDTRENWIMQSLSHLDPKKSIYPIHCVSIRPKSNGSKNPTFGCNSKALNRTRVWYLNSWIISRKESPGACQYINLQFDCSTVASHLEFGP